MYTKIYLGRLTVWAGMAVLLAAGAGGACARSANGNDFALSYVEASGEAARKALLDEAGNRPHFFRYLQIMEMQEIGEGGGGGVRITALEPASALDVVFTVTQPVSLKKLREDPVSAPGRALAVSGVIKALDPATRVIQLDPVVVRHKDRLAPVAGKELLYEVDEGGIFYAFTGGREPVKLSFRDRDLLRHRDRVMAAGGDQAWADFLTLELKRREAARRAGEQGP